MSTSNATSGRPMDLGELRRAAAAIVRIEQAGRLDDLKAEMSAAQCWPMDRTAEMQHATAGQQLYIDGLARLLGRVLGVPSDQAQEAAIDVVLETHRRRALDIIARHDPQRDPDEYGILDTFNRYGLDAMLDLGPPRRDQDEYVPAAAPASPPPVQIRLVPGTMEGTSA
jgi:hypothetical protein